MESTRSESGIFHTLDRLGIMDDTQWQFYAFIAALGVLLYLIFKLWDQLSDLMGYITDFLTAIIAFAIAGVFFIFADNLMWGLLFVGAGILNIVYGVIAYRLGKKSPPGKKSALNDKPL